MLWIVFALIQNEVIFLPYPSFFNGREMVKQCNKRCIYFTRERRNREREREEKKREREKEQTLKRVLMKRASFIHFHSIHLFFSLSLFLCFFLSLPLFLSFSLSLTVFLHPCFIPFLISHTVPVSKKFFPSSSLKKID